MTAAATEAPPRVRRDGPLAGVVALVACGFFALQTPPVPDHGYQFHLAGRLLDGARLYVDIAAADMHPPLFTWLAAGIEAAGRAAGVSGLDIFPWFVVACVAAVLAAVWRIGPRSGWLLVGLVVALLPAAGPYFGQGEHLALMLSLPYLFAAAAAARGDVPAAAATVRGGRAGSASASGLSPASRFAIAAAGAIGMAMKPHFALVWAGTELYLARRRGARSLLRLESVTIGAVFVLYVAVTALLAPAFFELLPWLAALYPRFAPVPFVSMVLDWRLLLVAAGLAAAYFARRADQGQRAPGTGASDGRTIEQDGPDRRALADVLAMAMLAMYAALLLQLKGWGYHWYPVVALALLLLGVAAEPYAARFRVALPAVVLAAGIVSATQVDRTARLLASWPTMLPEMLRIVDARADGRPVLALSQYLHVGFPLVNLTQSRWASPYAHYWMVPAMYSERWYGGGPIEYRRSGEWSALEQRIFDDTWAAIERERPALLIVETPHQNDFDMRSYFETDDRFRRLFQSATALDTIAYYVVYELGGPRAGVDRSMPARQP